MIRLLSLCLGAIFLVLPGMASAQEHNEKQAIIQLVDEISLATGWKQDDIRLLAHVICGEARGESYQGKVAVGAVVINRMKSPQFPNTIKEVVYQKRAFTCVSDGQINIEPDLVCYKAACDAILGKDPTNGCLFYLNPKVATSRWMNKRMSATTTTVIGNHTFMK